MYNNQYFNQSWSWWPANAKNPTLEWWSDAPGIFTVSNGTVYSAYSGSWGSNWAWARTTDGTNIAKSFWVDVQYMNVSGASLNVTSLSMNTGDGYQLQGYVYPAEATDNNVSWSSSNESIATVNGGYVRAKKAGTCTITMRTADGGYTAACTVTVKGNTSGGSGGSNGGNSSGGGNNSGNSNNGGSNNGGNNGNSSGGGNGNTGGSNNTGNLPIQGPKQELLYEGYRPGTKDSAPEFLFDNDFPYDPNEEPNAGDYALTNFWNAWAHVCFANCGDAWAAYWHYRDGSGEDREVDYERAYNEDSSIKKKIDNEIDKIRIAVSKFYNAGAGKSFTIMGPEVAVTGTLSNNWDMTLGEHRFYIYTTVSINEYESVKTANITAEIIMEDMYNFNDNESGISDANGRFATLGWAKQYKNYGSFKITPGEFFI